MSEYVASVFLSYSHADKPLAQALCRGLTQQGCRVWIDEGELKIGDSLVQSISEALDRVDFVAVLVSRASVGSDWCRKEVSLAMTGELNRQGVTVLPLQVDGTPMPETLKDKLYLSIDHNDIDAAVHILMRDIKRHINPGAALPPRRRASQDRKSAPNASDSPLEPIKLTGIDSDGITEPRNDGTRGSALYSVPFTLSRTPDAEWSRMLVSNWDQPPSWTTMHRPGIARVNGSRIILNGTTVEEVERYHLETLKLAVEVTNRDYMALQERKRAQAEALEAQSRERRTRIENTLGRLDFD